jgi:hypothetical protein
VFSPVAAVVSPVMLVPAVDDVVASFGDDVRGIRCSRGTKSGDVFNDYLDIRRWEDVPHCVSGLNWYLCHDATIEQ